MERVSTVTPIYVHQSSPLQKRSYRIESIDLLRGLVMIIMALDHTRDFFHQASNIDDPLNLATTTPFLYFTRWITHFCAPVFVFLSGTSVYLQSLRKTKKQLSVFLITRGSWLILVELFVMNFAFSFDVYYPIVFLQTIWSIGISMIFLGLAIWLPFTAILTAGLIIVFGHNLLDFYEKGLQSDPGFLYSLLHRQGLYTLWKGHNLFILYPFLAWTGLMFLGYCFGRIFQKTTPSQRMKILTILGGSVILFFIALRASNVYGDPGHWTTQKNGTYTFLSFMNVQKYPPSLLYLCATIGPAILFLAWAGNAKSRLSKIITIYGRVPFFYYIIHFYVLHFLSMILFFARGHSFKEGWNSPLPFKFILPGDGYNLLTVYLIWISVVAALYPLCKWFSQYKQTHKQWWLSYL
jgi:uncharacterized membrane protein